MSNKSTIPKLLYLVMTNKCPLDCPFCFNKFVTNFAKCGDKPLSLVKICSVMNDFKPDMVNFIGGEPLLFPKRILEVLEMYKDMKIAWYISSNLFYKEFTDLQMEVFRKLQEYSIEDVTIGTSYNLDRFRDKPEYFELFKKNMLFLDSQGIKVGVTVTITKDQTKISVDDLYSLLKEVKAKAVNLERCIHAFPKNEEERKELVKEYEMADEYMCECFKKLPRELNFQFDRFYEAVKFRVPIFYPHCSEAVLSLYDHGLYKSCPLNTQDMEKHNFIDKIEHFKCYSCEYFPYCKGDCECVRGVCAFPKKTIQYIKDIVYEDMMKSKGETNNE